MSGTVLQLEGVSRSFDRKTVLRGVDLAVGAGEIAVLVGASGSGKTTLLRIAAGLERAEAGCVRLGGTIVDAPGRRPVPPERRGLGMVFQEHALWPHLTAAENVSVALPRGTRGAERAAFAWLAAVELTGLEQRRPAALSGGQQQRVALARALATGSALVLLDEPLSSLDEMVRDRLRPLIRDRLRGAGRAALLVSHDRVDAWRMADRIYVLDGGVLTQSGAPHALYAAPATMTVARYMGAVGRVRVEGKAPGHVVVAATGASLVCRSELRPGKAGVALAHPEAIEIGGAGDLAATRQDCVFEAGRWRTRWQVGAPGDELLGLHPERPPGHATLRIDPSKLFAFPDA